MLNVAEVVRVVDKLNLNIILYNDKVKLCSIHSIISLKQILSIF